MKCGCVQAVEEVAARRKVRHRVEMLNQDPPATCSNQVRTRRLPLSAHCCQGLNLLQPALTQGRLLFDQIRCLPFSSCRD